MKRALAVCIITSLCGAAGADVFNMGGTRNPDGSWTGLASLETVPVGNPGNAGEASGSGFYFGEPRICGAVDYAYSIGKYEVTAGQYCEFLNAVATTDTYDLYSSLMASTDPNYTGCMILGSGSVGNRSYSVASDWANRPVNHLNWGSAARFCNWLHNGQPTGAQDLTTTEDGSYFLNGETTREAYRAVTREADATWAIPTEDEWYKAAYHKNDGATANYWDYPTQCSDHPSNDLIDPDPGNNATYWDESVGDWTIGVPYYRTEVGAHENSVSPYGTFDQGGNVWEFNESIVAMGPDFLGRGVRGGCYYPTWPGVSDLIMLSAQCRAYGVDPLGKWWDYGFRVVEVPEPATLALLALGGAALIRRRR